jgi:uncharacterized cupredoxin-like copper-binding protein
MAKGSFELMGSARRAVLMTALAGLASIGLVACGGENTNTTTNNTPGTGAATSVSAPSQELKVSLIEWSIEPKDAEIQAGKTRIFVSNDGQFPHDLMIEVPGGSEVKTPVFSPGEGPQTLDVDLAAGTYRWICTVGDHAERGMQGELTVK